MLTSPSNRSRGLTHTFDPGRTPTSLRRFERDPDWRLPPLEAKYSRLSTDRDTADEHHLEWITPGHPPFEAVRRRTWQAAQEALGKGACFHSLAHDAPARIDLYRARVVDGLGHVVHERLFAVELAEGREPALREPALLGNFTVAEAPEPFPAVAHLPEAASWLQDHALHPFLEEVRQERQTEVEHVAEHVELSLTELLARADEEIGRAAAEVERKTQGAEGRLAQAETRHAESIGELTGGR